MLSFFNGSKKSQRNLNNYILNKLKTSFNKFKNAKQVESKIN
jgi:hypothetical protein